MEMPILKPNHHWRSRLIEAKRIDHGNKHIAEKLQTSKPREYLSVNALAREFDRFRKFRNIEGSKRLQGSPSQADFDSQGTYNQESSRLKLHRSLSKGKSDMMIRNRDIVTKLLRHQSTLRERAGEK